MFCLTCFVSGRECDGQRVVCRTCYREQESWCSWLLSQDLRNIRNPYRSPLSNNISPSGAVDSRLDNHCIDNREMNYSQLYQLLLGFQGSPHIMRLVEDERSQRFLAFDPELREHFRSIDTESNLGQEELATAILAANMQDVLGSSARAMDNYNEALLLMRATDLNYAEIVSPGSFGVAISLANIFELYNTEEDGPKLMHLRQLQYLVRQTPTSRSQPLGATNTVMKSLVYHTAIGSLFSFADTARGLPYTYITNIHSHLANTSEYQSRVPSSYLGIPLQLLDVIFQISLARRGFKSGAHTDETRAYLISLGQQLGDLTTVADPALHPWHMDDTRTKSVWIEQLVSLMRSACLILIATTADDLAVEGKVRQILDHIWSNVMAIDLVQHHKAIVWPLLVLYFAGNAHERYMIRKKLNQLARFTQIRKLDSIVRFLQEIEEHQASTGRNNLLWMLWEDNVKELTLF